jgi:hypothetical protein
VARSWPIPVGHPIAKRFVMVVHDMGIERYFEDTESFEKTTVDGVLKELDMLASELEA